LKNIDFKPTCSAAETYLSIGGILLAAAVFVASDSYPDIAWTLGGPPGYYPRLLALLLAGLSLAVFVEGVFRPMALRRPRGEIVVRVACLAAVLALAPVGIGILGFLFAGVLVSFALMALLVDWEVGILERAWGLLLPSIGCTVVLFVVFRYLAGVRLPAGVWFG